MEPQRVWVETGGDTGGAETYSSAPDTLIGGFDWDDWNEPDWDYWDDLFSWLRLFGDVMPRTTRVELLNRLESELITRVRPDETV